MFSILLLLLSTLIMAIGIGLRAREPMPAEQSLIVDPVKRSAVWTFYIVNRFDQMIVHWQNRFSHLSWRYGSRDWQIDALMVFIGVSMTLLGLATHLAWLLFETRGFGPWDFYPETPDPATKLRLIATYACCAILAIYITLDWDHLVHSVAQFAGDLAPMLAGLIYILVVGFYFLTYGNSALIATLFLGPMFRWQGHTGLLLVAILILVMKGSETQATLLYTYVLAAAAGGLANLAYRATVELFATANWYSQTVPESLFMGAAWVVSGAFAVATPVVAKFVFIGVALVIPGSLSIGSDEVIAELYSGAWDMSVLLAISSLAPLLPVAGFTLYCLGGAVAQLFPSIQDFMTQVKEVKGPINRAQYDTILAGRRTAFFRGYLIASLGMGLVLVGATYALALAIAALM